MTMKRTAGTASKVSCLSARLSNEAPAKPAGSKLGWCAWIAVGALTASFPAFAQKKTGPDITSDDALTWHGITLYGVVDIGLQYDTHGAPFTDYRPAASANIVQKNSRQSVLGATPSNLGQSRIGLQGVEPINDEWSAIFRLETDFNPQSGQIADSLKSLTTNNGRTSATSGTSQDGSSAGQAFQTAFAGLSTKRFGAVTFGRQQTLMLESMIKYDPNSGASAFGLLGASGAYQGAGSTEDRRLDSMLKYSAVFEDIVHVGALYKFNNATGGANTAFQAVVGAEYAGASIDALYSKINDAIAASALSATQVTETPALGYSVANSVSATVSDNTALALMGRYAFEPITFFLGFENIKYENPTHPLSAGFSDIGGYNLAFVTDTAYTVPKILNVYWTGVRYAVLPRLDLTAAYYGYHQSAYGTGKVAGCSNNASNYCSGNFQSYVLTAVYAFNPHVDAYGGAMYSGVHDGLANGYTFHTTNINPTIGVRIKF